MALRSLRRRLSYLRQVILTREHVEQLQAGLEKATDRLEEHDRRLVRIEKIIDLAQRSRLPRN